LPSGDNMRKHGKYNTKLYFTYNNILTRLRNPNHSQYKDYGGRGITMCDEWLDKENGFINFYNWAMANGYTEGLTIDRKDVNGNYTPNNCQWVTMKAQGNNRRSNVNYTYGGKTMTAAEWSRHLGGNKDLVYNRIRHGWSEERALTTPAKSKKS